MEKLISNSEGVEVVHARAKQRNDKQNTKFLVPRMTSGVNYAEIVEEYLHHIRHMLGKTSGRLWYTGNQDRFTNTPMGKNYINKIPHEIAQKLDFEDVQEYTFHSFRRTAATTAADEGASPLQMQQHFGWKSVSMADEYISTSKAAIKVIAKTLAGNNESKVTQHEAGVGDVTVGVGGLQLGEHCGQLDGDRPEQPDGDQHGINTSSSSNVVVINGGTANFSFN